MVPLRKEQIRYIYKEDGTWKLNSKISPIPNIPEQWQFKGYFWGGRQLPMQREFHAHACDWPWDQAEPSTRRH